jgi:enoyl-CoA hydratase/carnithine racemase
MMPATPVSLTRRGAVAVITLDRPDRMNALSKEALVTLGECAREARRDPEVRAIVLTGAGEKAFCAGADLKERQGMTDDEVRAQLARYRKEMGELDASPKPVIAAINGLALGGGLELALACDLRVAAPSAVLGFPETSLGIIPGAGGTQRLPRLVGEARAKELILLGRRLSAVEALEWGLVNRVSPAGVSVLDDALSFIEPLTNGAPIALAAALGAIEASFDLTLAQGLELELACYEPCLTSEDRRAALEAFAQKKKPIFHGR